jgi:hypothetical protein
MKLREKIGNESWRKEVELEYVRILCVEMEK